MAVAFALVKFLSDKTYEVVEIENVKDFDDREKWTEREFLVCWPVRGSRNSNYYAAVVIDTATEESKEDLEEKRDELAMKEAGSSKARANEDDDVTGRKRSRAKKNKFSPEFERSKKVKVDKENIKPKKRAAHGNNDDLMERILQERTNHPETRKAGLRREEESDSEDTDTDDENLRNMKRDALETWVKTLAMKLRGARRKNICLQAAYTTLTTLQALPQCLTRLEQVATKLESTPLPSVVSTPRSSMPSAPRRHLALASPELQPVGPKPLQAPPASSSASKPAEASSKPAEKVPGPVSLLTPLPVTPAPKSTPKTQRTPVACEALADKEQNVILGQAEMRLLNHESASKLVNDMMASLFTEDEILTRTVVRQAGQPEETVLDQVRMAAMQKYVQERFPHIPDKSDGSKRPTPWTVRFRTLCRYKKSNVAKSRKPKRDAPARSVVRGTDVPTQQNQDSDEDGDEQ